MPSPSLGAERTNEGWRSREDREQESERAPGLHSLAPLPALTSQGRIDSHPVKATTAWEPIGLGVIK